MLEQQQQQLITALQRLYERLINNQGWKGRRLDVSAMGHPLTHDILERLDALRVEGHVGSERFEESPEVLQRRLSDDEKVHIKRQPSPESDSSEDHMILHDAPSPGLRCNPRSSLSTSQLPPTPSMHKQRNFMTTSPISFSTPDAVLQSPQHIQPLFDSWPHINGTYDPAMQFYPSTSTNFGDPGQFPPEFNPCISDYDEEMAGFSYGLELARKPSMQYPVR
ncbi:MAG: hypothetical protein Q9220_007037 [cf. Caloplaca sp. 1 TL-2023]